MTDIFSRLEKATPRPAITPIQNQEKTVFVYDAVEGCTFEKYDATKASAVTQTATELLQNSFKQLVTAGKLKQLIVDHGFVTGYKDDMKVSTVYDPKNSTYKVTVDNLVPNIRIKPQSILKDLTT